MKRRPRNSRRSIDHLGQTLRYHEVLLLDRARNAAFERALRARIRPGDRVLDVGTGSGVWAVVAARLGAAKVVAVEREPLLVPITRGVVAESGVADRVEVLAGEFRSLRLAREFDVVISETVGNFAFDEDVISIMAAARERCLVPGGALIPQAIRFFAAPVRRRRAVPEPGTLPVSLRSFRDLLAQFPRHASWAELTLVAPPRELARVDLATVEADRAGLGRVAAHWRLRRPVAIDGFAAWLGLDLAPGVSLDVRRCTNWHPLLFPLDGVPRAEKALGLVIEHSRHGRRWQVTFEGPRGREVREHCPELAYGAVRAGVSSGRRRS